MGVEQRRFTGAERGALVAAVVSGALVPLNSTMIAVALPDIAASTGVEAGRTALLVTGYLVVMLVFQPLGGRAGDRYGHKRVTAGALAGFGAASLIAAIAPSFTVLFVARCVQAVFGAALSPNLSAVLRHTIDVHRRGRAFGLMGSGIGTGAAVGPVLGGLLVAISDWRLMFLANVPVVTAALVLVVRLQLHEDAASSARDVERASIWSLLAHRPFLASCVTQATSNFSLYTTLLVLPLVLVDKGWSSGPTGFAVSGLTLGMLVLSPIGGRISDARLSGGDHRARAHVVAAGMAVSVVGCAVIAASLDLPWLLIAGAVVLGAGQGVAGASLSTAAVEAAPADAAATAAGVYSTSRYVGSIVGSVLIAALAVADASSARPLAFAIIATSLVAMIAGSRVQPAVAAAPGMRVS